MVETWFRKILYGFFQKNSNTSLPFSIKLDSGNPGKHIIIFGATHGSEKVGVRLARRFVNRHRSGKVTLKSGAITFILGNPRGFKANQRYIEDDLNRSFFAEGGDKASEKYEHQRAQAILQYMKDEHVDVSLDLHSVSVGDFKMLIARDDDKKAQYLLHKVACLDTMFLFEEEHVPHSTMAAACYVGATGLAVECGNHTKDSAIHTAEEVTYRILDSFSMVTLPKKYSEKEVMRPRVYRTIKRILAGHDFKYLIPKAETGVPLRKGEAFVETREHGIQKAPQDCVMFMPSKHPKPTDHDSGFLCVEE